MSPLEWCHVVRYCSPTVTRASVGHRSTAAVNNGQQWRTNVDHRQTTAGSPVNGTVKLGQWSGRVRSDVQKDLYKALVESYNSDKDIISSYGDVVTLKRGRDDHDKDEDPSDGSNRGSQPKSSGKSAYAEEHGQKVDDLEDQSHQEFSIENDDETFIREALDDDESQWNPSGSPTPDRDWHKTKNFLATPIDFSAFIMNRLKIKNLTQEVLTSPTYDLIKGMCKSVVELEYHLEEVFKATNDRLDWHNPKGKPYPYDLSKPLPLIKNERGRQVIPWDYFINNDLEYLKGGSSNKLTNLNLEEQYALNVALRMFTRRIVIQERVEDLQLGVESYQKKINLTKPNTYRFDLKRMTLYIAYPDIQGIIYEDEMNRNHMMRTDELHIRTALNDIDRGIEMDYLHKRKWSKQDK
ncbi:hypothetical protein Tco_0741665 [Tanacetum coccineum]